MTGLVDTPSAAASGAPTPEHVTVIKMAPDFERLVKTFETSGTSAVAEDLRAQMSDETQLAAWRTFVEASEAKVVEVKIHPNERAAVEWMNGRFHRMGLGTLSFEGVEDQTRPDPTELVNEKIKLHKWIRYATGPSIAALAVWFGMPSQSVHSVGDLLYLVIPAATVGVTTVALELQFAWPWLNDHFWKKMWTLGGPIGGRITNTLVNFTYGMILWGANVGGAHLPALLGTAAVPTSALPFTQAVTSAAVGALIFHLAMGQFQTDIATEEGRGSITGPTRYGLETIGSLVVNGARVASWVLPQNLAGYTVFAQLGFFLMKTFPQALKTNVVDKFVDHEIARAVNPAQAPLRTFGERCGDLLAKFPLVNLPRLVKQ